MNRSENIHSIVQHIPDIKKIKVHEELLYKLKQNRHIKEAISKILVCKSIDSYGDTLLESRKNFIKCSGYKDKNRILGEGSYGSVFSVTKDSKEYAVKQIKVYDEISILDEIKLTLLFSNKSIGPKINGFFRVNVNNSGGYIFIVMEKMDNTLTDYIKKNGFSKSKEEELFRLLRKTIDLKVVCTDIKPDNIMVKDTSSGIVIRLIDFGEFCCDMYSGYDEKVSLDLLLILTAYTLKSHGKITLFKKDISEILDDRKRFALIIKGIIENTKKCSIIDIYAKHRNETFGSKCGRQLNHYATKKFIKKYKLKKGVHYFKDRKPEYLDKYFGEKGSKKAIHANRFSKTDQIKVWSARVIVTAVFILSGYRSKYSKILPKKYWDKLVKNNRYLYSKNLRFYKKTKKSNIIRTRKRKRKHRNRKKKTTRK